MVNICMKNTRTLNVNNVQPDPNKTEAILSNGLVMGHAYSVTAVKQVKLSDGAEAQLLRLRNPWGNDTEWNGAWSDQSSEWRKVSEEERKAIGLTFDDDGALTVPFSALVALCLSMFLSSKYTRYSNN